jgi:hypothetical protein
MSGVSASALAEYLTVSREEVKRLTGRGVLQKSDNGYDLDRSRQAYIQHLRQAAHAGNELNTARTRLLELRAELRPGRRLKILGSTAFLTSRGV